MAVAYFPYFPFLPSWVWRVSFYHLSGQAKGQENHSEIGGTCRKVKWIYPIPSGCSMHCRNSEPRIETSEGLLWRVYHVPLELGKHSWLQRLDYYNTSPIHLLRSQCTEDERMPKRRSTKEGEGEKLQESGSSDHPLLPTYCGFLGHGLGLSSWGRKNH